MKIKNANLAVILFFGQYQFQLGPTRHQRNYISDISELGH